MQQYAEEAVPRSQGSISRTRAIGSEAPLRQAIEDGERLLVAVSVRFPDAKTSQPLWLTDRRFLFTRKQGSAKLLVSVPLSGSDLGYEAGDYPLQLRWADDAGRSWVTAFRSPTWKDSVTGGSATASGGASGGIAGALIGLAVDAGIGALVRKPESASRDEGLYSILTAAMRTPADVRPVDLTSGSLSTVSGRLWVGAFIIIPSVLVIGSAIYALLGYQSRLAYEHAMPCGSIPRVDCRILKPGVVIDFRGAPGKYAYCDLWLRVADGSTVEADLHNYGLCASRPLGRHMNLEYFRGSLTGVLASGSGPAQPDEETADNPEYDWRLGAIIAAVVAPFSAIFLTAALVSIVGWWRRRSLLHRSARQAGYLA